MAIRLAIGAVIAIAVAALAVTPVAAQPPVEAKYVTPQFAAALVFEPARLDKAAIAAGLPAAEYGSGGVLWYRGSSLSGSRSRRSVLGGNAAFMPAFVLRYPADRRQEATRPARRRRREFKVGDVAYVRARSVAKFEMAGYAIDDRMLARTLEPMLKPGGE